jgi:hypothetical protein
MSSRVWRCVLIFFLSMTVPVQAESRSSTAAVRAEQIRPLVRAAGVIFSGRVSSVRLIPAALPGTVTTVEVHFRVEHGFRGVRDGSDLAIREWPGLWAAQPRYRVGERVTLFLYPPSSAGLTSWVGGPRGRLAVDSGGRILLGPAEPMPRGPGSTHDGLVQPRAGERLTYRDFSRLLRQAERGE